MLQRTSYVDKLNVEIASFSSILQIGDSCIINGLSRAMAIQREAEIAYGNEGNFSAYRVFSEPIPFQPITEPISMRIHNTKPVVKVQTINVIGFSSSSILHIGNSKHISLEARVKHIRQLLPERHEQEL